MNVEQTIREYLPEVAHLSLATSSGDQPWVCEVHFVYDDDLNLYFVSKPSRRHSREIAENPQVAGNIVKAHGARDKVRGVYFEGTAELLTDVDEGHVAFKLYGQRFGAGPGLLEEVKQPDGHKFYQITVKTYYVFDNQESNPSQKYELPWPASKD